MQSKINLEQKTYPTGTWISINSPTVAEVTASLPVDFVVIDTEHSAMGLETVENMIRGVDAVNKDTGSIVRVPGNDKDHLKRVLDIGVDGILVPRIETAEQARSLVEAVTYPPKGDRGIASGRASNYGDDFQKYVEHADDLITTIAQIETKRGVENASEIATVEGIDAIFIGPADLSGSLGVFAQWDSELLNQYINEAIQAGKEHQKPVGTLVIQQEDIKTRIDQGFDFLAVGKDTSTLGSGTNELISTCKDHGK
ncbi:HpcH/HpaI aldolase family protein [Halobacterium sp. KA-6]|uniref:HpcH/HpaI aldolase family protein n=1 Tax=Halobacterium sp. KA-6 TaxID=2896368 RepID=UPI001E3B9EF8|nr:aldolase/citrate lyase family protein [Halobacterium sp. KA-6]MCD2205211.1 aldolase/citrate lyase family protein [Halobacterium sp. KA-6]